jgi:hypothetical protein
MRNMLGVVVVLVLGTSSAWGQAPPPGGPPLETPPGAITPVPAADPMGQPPGTPTGELAPPSASGPYVPPGAAPEQAEPSVDHGVLEDANATTNFFMPTALTPPAGTFGFHDYELFIIGASYAPTDQFLISASTLVPLVNDQPFVGLFSAKYQVLRSGSVRVAAHGSTLFAAGNGDSIFSGALGGVATVCLNLECSSHLSGYAAAGFASGTSSAVPFVFSGGAVLKLSRRVKFLVEGDGAFVAGEVNDLANGFLLWYGLRFTSANISGDVGFVKPVSYDDSYDTEVFPIGFPVVSFTYRSDP